MTPSSTSFVRRAHIISMVPLALPALARAEVIHVPHPQITVFSGQLMLGIGASIATTLLAFLLLRKRAGRRFSFSLRWLLAFCLACSVMVWGAVRWHLGAGQLRDYDEGMAMKGKLSRLVSFCMADTPLEDCLTFLSTLTKVRLDIDPSIQDSSKCPINLRVQDMKLETTLAWIARLNALKWKVVDKNTLTLYKPAADTGNDLDKPARCEDRDDAAKVEVIKQKLKRKISFEFCDAPLRDDLDFIRSWSQLTIFCDSAIDKKKLVAPNLEAKDLEVGTALHQILSPLHLDYEICDSAVFIFRPEDHPNVTAEWPRDSK